MVWQYQPEVDTTFNSSAGDGAARMKEILSSYPSGTRVGLASEFFQVFWPSLRPGLQRQGRTQLRQLPVGSSIKLCEQLRVCCHAGLVWQLGDVWEARPNGMGGHIGGRQEASRDWLVYCMYVGYYPESIG